MAARRSHRNPSFSGSDDATVYAGWYDVSKHRVARADVWMVGDDRWDVRLTAHDGGELEAAGSAWHVFFNLNRGFKGVDATVNGVGVKIGSSLWRQLARQYAGENVFEPTPRERRAAVRRGGTRYDYGPTREFFLYSNNDYDVVMSLRRVQRELDARGGTGKALRARARELFRAYVTAVVQRYNGEFTERLRLGKADVTLIERLLWEEYARGERV